MNHRATPRFLAALILGAWLGFAGAPRAQAAPRQARIDFANVQSAQRLAGQVTLSVVFDGITSIGPVDAVNLYVDGRIFRSMEIVQARRSGVQGIQLDTQRFPNGERVLKVVALVKNRPVAQRAISIVISNNAIDMVPPLVALRLFANGRQVFNGDTVNGKLSVELLANDRSGIGLVSIFANRKPKLISNQFPYKAQIDSADFVDPKTMKGKVTLEAWAFDKRENEGRAKTVTLLIDPSRNLTNLQVDPVQPALGNVPRGPQPGARPARPLPLPAAGTGKPVRSRPVRVARNVTLPSPLRTRRPRPGVPSGIRVGEPKSRPRSIGRPQPLTAAKPTPGLSPARPVAPPAGLPRPAAAGAGLTSPVARPQAGRVGVAKPVFPRGPQQPPRARPSIRPAARPKATLKGAPRTTSGSAKPVIKTRLRSQAPPVAGSTMPKVAKATLKNPLRPLATPPGKPGFAGGLRGLRPTMPPARRQAKAPVLRPRPARTLPTPTAAPMPAGQPLIIQPDLRAKPDANGRVPAQIFVAKMRQTSRRYTVRKSDSLRRIASRYGVTPRSILIASGLRDNARLRPGMKVTIPGSFNVVLGGSQIDFDVPPRIENGLPLAPFRKIFEHAGGTVVWYPHNRTVRAARPSLEVKLTIGSKQALVNNDIMLLKVPAHIDSGRTIVPLQFLERVLDLTAEYDVRTGSIYLVKK